MKKIISLLLALSFLLPSVALADQHNTTNPDGFGPPVQGTNPADFGRSVPFGDARQTQLTEAAQVVNCSSEGEFGGAVANALGVALQQVVSGTLLGQARGVISSIAQQAGPFAPLVNAIGNIALNRIGTALNNAIGSTVQNITGQIAGQVGGQAGSALADAVGSIAGEHLGFAGNALGLAGGITGAVGAVAVPTNEVGPVNPNIKNIMEVTKINREHLNQLEQTEKVLAYKECVSDPLIAASRNALLTLITRSMVDWVNGGFDGGTAFIQNLRQFLQTGINAVAQDFIENQTVGICAPYRQDVQRILLTQYQYSTNYGRKSQCTYNETGLAAIASGKYNHQAWLSGVFNPNNRAIYQYYAAQDEQNQRIGEYALEQITQYGVNAGYQDIQKCADGSQAKKGLCADGSAPQTTLKGIHIKDAVDRQLGLANEQLLDADEIGEVIDALMQSLTQVAFTSVDGLLGLSKKGGSNGSYLDQVVGANVGSAGDSVQTIVASDIQGALETERQYGEVLELVVADLRTARTAYTDVIACYRPLTSTGKGAITPQLANEVIAHASTTIAQVIMPQLVEFERQLRDSEDALLALQALREEAQSALSVADVNDVTSSFNALRNSGLTHNATDLQYLMRGAEYGGEALEALLQDANVKLLACRAP